MTQEELNEIIKDSEYKDWFETCKLELYFIVADTKKVLVGFLNIYSFFEEQLNEWEEKKAPEITPFKESINWLERSLDTLNKLLNDISNGWVSMNQCQRKLEDITPQNSRAGKYCYLSEFQETGFLLDLAEKGEDHVIGAHEFFSDDIYGLKKDVLEGRMLAYEMRTKDLAHLVDRKEQDRRSFSKLQADYKAFLKKLEKSHEDIANEKRAINEKYHKEFDESKTSINERLKILEKKYKDDSEWAIRESKGRFDEIEKGFEQLKKDTDKQFKDHAQAYAELLMLKQPAQFWAERAEGLKKVGNNWMYALIAASVAGLITIITLIFIFSGEWFHEQIKNPAVSIRWSILSLVLLTLIGFMIRVFTKMMMSNFHLYRDAEERKQLTYLYLSLIKEADISDADRNVVLQALFSRADTGLLKDDSSPSMPAIHLDKLNS